MTQEEIIKLAELNNFEKVLQDRKDNDIRELEKRYSLRLGHLQKQKDRILNNCDHKRPDDSYAVVPHIIEDNNDVYLCILCSSVLDSDMKKIKD
jgi:hypothetical protein